MSRLEIINVRTAMHQMYGVSMENFISNHTSGSLERLMMALYNYKRDETVTVDLKGAQFDALSLRPENSAFNENLMIRILVVRNFNQIKLILQQYHKMTRKSLKDDIVRSFSGDFKAGLLAIIDVAQDRPLYFASLLYKSMKGLGTDDRTLIRLVVTRSEIDMVNVKDAFLREYKDFLKSFIEGDTSFHYRSTLLALIGENI
jgi:annexin A7/11